MLNGLLSTMKDYKGLNSGLDRVIDYIDKNNLEKLPLGKTILDDEITITRLEYVGKEPGQSFPEEHQKHLDLQIVLSGQELCYFDYLTKECSKHIQTPYNEEKDVIKYDVPLKNKIIFTDKNFTLFFPTDVHLPAQKIDNNLISKLVIKILIK